MKPLCENCGKMRAVCIGVTPETHTWCCRTCCPIVHHEGCVDSADDYEPPQFSELRLTVSELGRQYEIALQALLTIAETMPGTQEVEWYRDVATRALEQLREV